jgi:hypothetical protein
MARQIYAKPGETLIPPMDEVFRYTETCGCAVIFARCPKDREVWSHVEIAPGCSRGRDRRHDKAQTVMGLITAGRAAYRDFMDGRVSEPLAEGSRILQSEVSAAELEEDNSEPTGSTVERVLAVLKDSGQTMATPDIIALVGGLTMANGRHRVWQALRVLSRRKPPVVEKVGSQTVSNDRHGTRQTLWALAKPEEAMTEPAKTTAHTPGPWHWNGLATIWYTPGEPGEVDRDIIVAEVICDYLDSSCVEPIPVREANARLIAAAPDLLAALESVVRICDRKTDVFDAAKAAIKKARGE